jgi:hypothetical protein
MHQVNDNLHLLRIWAILPLRHPPEGKESSLQTEFACLIRVRTKNSGSSGTTRLGHGRSRIASRSISPSSVSTLHKTGRRSAHPPLTARPARARQHPACLLRRPSPLRRTALQVRPSPPTPPSSHQIFLPRPQPRFSSRRPPPVDGPAVRCEYNGNETRFRFRLLLR